MNVYDPYPSEVEVDGRVYRLDLSYDRVLKCMDAADEPLTEADRVYVQCGLLLADDEPIPEDVSEQLKIIEAALALIPKHESEDGQRYIDFHQDAEMIRSAFFRIGIDLTRQKIHFFQFLELLSDLPSDTALMRTVDIRRRPIPKATKHNMEQIAELQKAKARVAIRYSDEESRERFAAALKKASIFRG